MACQKALIYAVPFFQLLLKPIRLVLQLSDGFENVHLNVQWAMWCFGGGVICMFSRFPCNCRLTLRILLSHSSNWSLGRNTEAAAFSLLITPSWHHCSMDMSMRKLQEMVKESEAWCAAVYGVVKSRTWLRDWKKKKSNIISIKISSLISLHSKCLRSMIKWCL